MSTIHVLIMEKSTLYHKTLHYRALIEILRKGTIRQLQVVSDKKYLDGGILIIDVDADRILSMQGAFSHKDIKSAREWDWLEL